MSPIIPFFYAKEGMPESEELDYWHLYWKNRKRSIIQWKLPTR